jgi:hypothetical protein
MHRFVIQTSSKELDVTPFVNALSVYKTSLSPVVQVYVSLRFDKEYVTSTDIATAKKAIVEWELQTLTKEDVVTLELQILNFSPSDPGVLGSHGGDTQQTPVLNTFGLHAIPYNSLFLWKSYEGYFDSISSETLLRDICGGTMKQLDPPSLQTLQNVYIPTMSRLRALSTVVRNYNVYNNIVFFFADLDGVYLIDSTRSINDPKKTLYYLPDWTDFQKYAGKSFARTVYVTHSYAPSSLRVPKELTLVDYTHSKLYDQSSFPISQLSSVGNFQHLVDYHDKQLRFGGSGTKATVSYPLLSSLLLRVDCSYIDPIELTVGMCVELKSEDMRFAHLSGRYIVLEMEGKYMYQTIHKQSTSLTLGRCGV